LGCAIFAILIWIRGPKQYVLAAIPILSIILIGHRSGFLALGIGLLLLFFWMRQVGKTFLFAYTTVFFTLLSFIVLDAFLGYDFLSDAYKRITDTLDTTNPTTVSRAYAVRDNFFVFLKKPLFGIGYNYEELSQILAPPLLERVKVDGFFTVAELNVLHPHNFIMKFLSHTGLTGTSLILLIIISVFRRCYALITSEKHVRDVGIFLFCSLAFFIIMALMNTIFFPHGFMFWTLCGMTILFYDRPESAGSVS
jgi:O-antigen ligase